MTVVLPPGFPPKVLRFGIPVLGGLLLLPSSFAWFWFSEAPLRFRLCSVAGFGLFALLSGLGVISRGLRSWEFVRDPDTLTIRKKGILGTRSRRYAWSRLKSMTTPRSGTKSPELGPDIPLYELRIELEGMKPIRLLRGEHREESLRWLVWNLRTLTPEAPPRKNPLPLKRPAPQPKPGTSQATLEPAGDGIRIVLPPLGVFTPQPNGALVGSLVLPVASLVAGGLMWVYRASLSGFWPIAMGTLALFVLIGSFVVIMELNQRCRSGLLEASPSRLRISTSAIFGTRTLEWSMSRIGTLRRGFSGSTVNGFPQMELEVLFTEGPPHSSFKGRDPAELDWVAGEIGRFLPASALSPQLSLVPASGVCPVCQVELVDSFVLCVRCRTPHHAECWGTAGQCGVIGCRERRFTRT